MACIIVSSGGCAKVVLAAQSSDLVSMERKREEGKSRVHDCAISGPSIISGGHRWSRLKEFALLRHAAAGFDHK